MDNSGSVLQQIAKLLGKEEALSFLEEAAAREEAGDCEGAIQNYRRAYRLWPALDSVEEDDIPLKVKQEAKEAGIDTESLTQVHMDMSESPRFAIDDEASWLAYLEEYGYVVLKNAATAEDVSKGKSLVWDFMESVPWSKVSRKDASTWDKESGWLPQSHTGILGGHGFNHSDFCWQTRLLPDVKKAFSALWETDDLIVSFDGANLFRPWVNQPEWKTMGSWWHTDQNPFLPGREKRCCVQGFVTYTDATPSSGGLCVVPGSHKSHHEYCSRAFAQKIRNDFVSVPAGDPALRSGSKLVCAKAGDLVLWDSRTLHCNTPGQEGAAGPEKQSQGRSHADPYDASQDVELLRLVGYVCMTPAAWATSDVLESRKQAYLDGTSTGHWPHYFDFGMLAPAWVPRRSWCGATEEQKRMIVGASNSGLLSDPESAVAENKALLGDASSVSLLARLCPSLRAR